MYLKFPFPLILQNITTSTLHEAKVPTHSYLYNLFMLAMLGRHNSLDKNSVPHSLCYPWYYHVGVLDTGIFSIFMLMSLNCTCICS